MSEIEFLLKTMESRVYLDAKEWIQIILKVVCEQQDKIASLEKRIEQLSLNASVK